MGGGGTVQRQSLERVVFGSVRAYPEGELGAQLPALISLAPWLVGELIGSVVLHSLS